ncbi:hypothetical protein SAMN04488063_3269 [Halopelagius inordinatus]|uniref:Uncharacterized protein n=1 Tax=Halopelagius inordinatus TaxID=553467 RepID=A0A1I2VSN7_9EURY|nr:hypothetical protein [Halopelagius inordinatus]SFG91347.1 hypothetical protein SAMN04488063_3269 [Halopelagius inordinatus]
MKSGASDPFADDGDETDETESDETRETETRTSEVRADETNPSAPGSDESGSETDDDGDGPGDGDRLSRDELPLILRRDKVKDERPEVHQLFVQRETHEAAVDAERALEKRLGEGLSRTDAREAIYLAGMRHLGDAEDVLREWGYDL